MEIVGHLESRLMILRPPASQVPMVPRDTQHRAYCHMNYQMSDDLREVGDSVAQIGHQMRR